MPRPAAKPKKVVRRVVKRATVGTVRGRGDYTYAKPGPWGRIGRAVGRQAGGMIGSQYGVGRVAANLGEKVGSYAHFLGKIFGSGDYTTASDGINCNSLTGGSMSTQTPMFRGGKNEVRLYHREFLQNIVTGPVAGVFDIQSFALNPGLQNTFPWLASLCAANFQQYRINGMVFEFRSMSADALNSTNTALGSVVMCTDYDSRDAVFTSKQQMENTMFGVSCKPSSNMIHAIECKKSQTAISELYIRAGAVPSNADIRMYDWGRFSVATQGGQAANTTLGELWVSYDITLIKPIDQPPGFTNPFAGYVLGSGITGSLPLGLSTPTIYAPTNGGDDQIGLTFSGREVRFPQNIAVGTVFMFNMLMISSVAAAFTKPAFTALGGLQICQWMNLCTPSVAATVCNEWQYVCAVKFVGAVAGVLPAISVGNFTWTATSSLINSNIWVTQMSGLFPTPFNISVGSGMPGEPEDEDITIAETEQAMSYVRVHDGDEKKTTLLRRTLR